MKTVERILTIVKNRNLNISVKDGQIFVGPKERTDAVLMQALRAFREDIIQSLGFEEQVTQPPPPPESMPMPDAPEKWMQILDADGKCIDAIARGDAWRDDGIAWRIAGYLHWHSIPGKEAVFPGKDGIKAS